MRPRRWPGLAALTPQGAPAYLAARGTPRSPADLAGHEVIFDPAISSRSDWAFKRRGAAVLVKVEGRIPVDIGEGMMACVRAGLGIAASPQAAHRAD